LLKPKKKNIKFFMLFILKYFNWHFEIGGGLKSKNEKVGGGNSNDEGCCECKN